MRNPNISLFCWLGLPRNQYDSFMQKKIRKNTIIDIILPDIIIQTWILKNPSKWKICTIKFPKKWHQNENTMLINNEIKVNYLWVTFDGLTHNPEIYQLARILLSVWLHMHKYTIPVLIYVMEGYSLAICFKP